MDESLVSNAMQGRHGRGDSLVLAAILETNPDAVAAAVDVPPDSFLLKLRQHLRSDSETTPMHDDAPQPTQLESDEDVRRVQAELRKASTPASPAVSIAKERRYRPSSRPPVAALIACDDGKDTGELFRIRGKQFLVGRSEGDLQLPHDEMVSSRHVAITRQNLAGKPRIVVTDLQSRNGLFVRVSKAPMLHQAEVLIGGGHYRMEIIRDVVPETADMSGQFEKPAAGTKALPGQSAPGGVILSEIVSGRVHTKINLDQPRYVIGRHDDCDIRRTKDRFTAPKHAVLSRSEKGTWVIENQATMNGVWLRIPQIILADGKSCEFRIGEQRFRLKLGTSK